DQLQGLCRQIDLGPDPIPPGACQYLVALWKFAYLQSMPANEERTNIRDKLAAAFEPWLPALASAEHRPDDWETPENVVMLLFLAAELFLGDNKGTSHKYGDVLFRSKLFSLVEVEVTAMFRMSPRFQTAWRSCQLQWSAYMDMRNIQLPLKDQTGIDRPYEEVFDAEGLWQQPIEHLCETVVCELTDNRRPEVALAASQLVSRLLSRHRTRNDHPLEPDQAGAVRIAE